MIGNKEQVHDGLAVRKERKFQELWELKLEGTTSTSSKLRDM
jgi:hypothetical protein